MTSDAEGRSPLFILFLVVLIDMIGFTLVIPFLTYFIQDLAEADGFVNTGTRDRWVGIVLACYTLGQFLFTPILGSLSDRVGRRPILMFGLISNTIFLISFIFPSKPLTSTIIVLNGKMKLVVTTYCGDTKISPSLLLIASKAAAVFTLPVVPMPPYPSAYFESPLILIIPKK